MANTSVTTTYDDFATATIKRYGHKKFEDNISVASKFLSWIMDDGKITKRMNGGGYRKGITVAGVSGERIQEPLMTDLNTTTKWYDGAEVFDTTQQNVGTSAFWDAKQLGGTITITGRERRLNKGKEAQINLLMAKTDQCTLTLARDMAQAVMSDGTGSSGKEIYGVRAITPTDRGTTVAYGDITANTSWWLCQRSRSGTTYGNVGDFATNFKKYARLLFSDCGKCGSSPDLHLVSPEMEFAYHDTLQAFERHESKKMLDLGYENVLVFMGQPVCSDYYHWSVDQSSQEWVMLNTEFISIRYDPDANFTTLGFQRPINADFISTPVIWMGAMTTNNRRAHGILTGITGVTN